jgi:hypothetical protein
MSKARFGSRDGGGQHGQSQQKNDWICDHPITIAAKASVARMGALAR